MPRGKPRLGSDVFANPMPRPEVVGVIPSDSPILDPTPQGPEAVWQSASGSISFAEEPPPWEVAGGDADTSDASQYVQHPPEVTLRWVNPKLLESQGWRDWRAVSASDSRFKILVSSMVSPDGLVRRGGATGDILAFMPTHWVVKRRAILEEKTRKQSQAAIDRQQELRDEFKRISPFLAVDSAKHPRYTNADGRTMTD